MENSIGNQFAFIEDLIVRTDPSRQTPYYNNLLTSISSIASSHLPALAQACAVTIYKETVGWGPRCRASSSKASATSHCPALPQLSKPKQKQRRAYEQLSSILHTKCFVYNKNKQSIVNGAVDFVNAQDARRRSLDRCLPPGKMQSESHRCDSLALTETSAEHYSLIYAEFDWLAKVISQAPALTENGICQLVTVTSG